jgi:hypothetical protein
MLILNTRGDSVLQPPVNRAKVVDELFEELLKKNDLPVVIYVTGDSGVGKTTIVEEAYEKLQINNHFDILPWSSIPPDMSVASIRQRIFEDLEEGEDLKLEAEASEKSKGKSSEKPKDKAGQKLNEKLREKKYLLVIDGEITNSRWNHILDTLTDTPGSKVLRITQDPPLVPPAKYESSLIEVRPLNEWSTTELFCQRVCKAGKKEKYNADVSTFVRRRYQKLIFQITEGLPLAIVLLAGLVKTKEFPAEWKAVFEHLKSKKLKRLDTILSLCFDDLPYDLKSCLLYFAALPERCGLGHVK